MFIQCAKKRHPITRHHRRAMGCIFWILWKKRYHEISRLHCMCWLVQKATTYHNQAWTICLILGIYCMCKPHDPEQLQADTVCVDQILCYGMVTTILWHWLWSHHLGWAIKDTLGMIWNEDWNFFNIFNSIPLSIYSLLKTVHVKNMSKA